VRTGGVFDLRSRRLADKAHTVGIDSSLNRLVTSQGSAARARRDLLHQVAVTIECHAGMPERLPGRAHRRRDGGCIGALIVPDGAFEVRTATGHGAEPWKPPACAAGGPVARHADSQTNDGDRKRLAARLTPLQRPTLGQDCVAIPAGRITVGDAGLAARRLGLARSQRRCDQIGCISSSYRWLGKEW
jgi:hypothetical protein